MPPLRRNAPRAPSATARSTRSHTLAPNFNSGPSGSNNALGGSNNTPNATDDATSATNSSNKRRRDEAHDSRLQDLEIKIAEKKLALLEQQLQQGQQQEQRIVDDEDDTKGETPSEVRNLQPCFP